MLFVLPKSVKPIRTLYFTWESNIPYYPYTKFEGRGFSTDNKSLILVYRIHISIIPNTKKKRDVETRPVQRRFLTRLRISVQVTRFYLNFISGYRIYILFAKPYWYSSTCSRYTWVGTRVGFPQLTIHFTRRPS